jgi:GNAT superfamily N-acetyltransferase
VSEAWLALAGEADDVTRLMIAFRDWLGEDQPGEDSFAASVAQLLADPATDFLLARLESGSPPCGVCQLRFRHSIWTDAPDCWLEDLYVEAPARGSGVGRALVELAFERAIARGARRIELDTNERNSGAIALYESLGFSASSKAHGELSGRDVFMGRPLR